MAMICAILLMGYSVLGLRFPGVGRDVGIVALIVVSTFAAETVDEVTLIALGRAAAAFVKDIAMVDLFMAMSLTNRSEEHTSELQSLMRTSYAVFCLKKKTKETNK